MIVLASASYASQSTVNSTLVTLNNATAIRSLYVGGRTLGEQYAALWAQGQGIPVIYMADNLDAAGYTYANKGLAMMQQALLSPARDARMATFGTSARIAAAIASAVPEGVTVTQV